MLYLVKSGSAGSERIKTMVVHLLELNKESLLNSNTIPGLKLISNCGSKHAELQMEFECILNTK